MTVLFCSKTNQAVTLTVSIAHSGEGEVWRTDRPGVLAKIYHVPKSHEIEKLAQMQERVAKLEVMVKRVPKDPNAHQNHISFAWPQSLLSNNEGEVVGFLMPEVENSLDLLKVCTPRLRKSLKLEISWYFLHVVARNVASIIQAIHYEGYVLGDIKLQNILVNNRALPTIIDTDSFQVIDPFENKIYRCLVGSEGFTPPELISQDIAMVTQSPVHDHFRLGVVIYYLLFSGPPFQGQWIGSGEPPEEAELIRRGLWPFASNSLIQPSKTTIPLNIIHPELERCFLRCFNEGHGMPYKRPTAEVWLKALEVAINDLVSCGKLDSHFYSSIFGRCYWCDRVQDLGVDIFSGNEIIEVVTTQSFHPVKSSKLINQPFVSIKAILNKGINSTRNWLVKFSHFSKKALLIGLFSGIMVGFSASLIYYYIYQIHVLDQILEANINLKDPFLQARISRNIATEYAKLNQLNKSYLAFKSVSEAINKIPDIKNKSSMLESLSLKSDSFYLWILDKTLENFSSLEIVYQIDDPVNKSIELSDVAVIYARLNQFSKALENLDKALEIANQINNNDKSRVLSEISMSYVKMNQFDKALEIANQINNNDKSRVLGEISMTYAKVNKFDKALEIANQINDYIYKENKVLREIAIRYAKANQFDKALEIANQLNYDSYRKTLREIAVVYIEINQFDKALEVINKLDSYVQRSKALSEVTISYSKMNQFDKALETVSQIEFYDDKSKALIEIAISYAKTNKVNKALEVFDEALEIVNQVEINNTYDSGRKSKALKEIAISYAEVNQFDKASEIANQVEIYEDKMVVLREIAIRYAKENQFDKALEIANQVNESDDKTILLRNIAVSCAKENQFDKALEIANQVNNNDDKRIVLREIAVIYTQAIQNLFQE